MVVVFAAVMISGCGKPEPKPKYTITEAHQKFEEKCLKDFNLHVRIKQVGRTVWIYLPTKDPIFDYEVQKEKKHDSKETPKYVVNFSDGKYVNEVFTFEYDIVNKKKAKEESAGFNSSYTDAYIKNQNNLFTTIYEVFLNAKPEGNETDPLFFVVIIADIKKGIETRLTFYLEDFIRAWSGDIPNDEYMKRVLSDQKGSSAIVGDETGSHLKYSDMTLGEFLAKQVLNRINYKFQYSDFTPQETNVDETIIGLVADTLRYYKFAEYTNIRMNNLRTNKKYLFEPDQLVNFGEDQSKQTKGKLIHIRFKDGKPEFSEDSPSGQPASTSETQTVQ
jgi:hypothetical protein